MVLIIACLRFVKDFLKIKPLHKKLGIAAPVQLFLLLLIV
jgi:hypothetical protein